MPEYFNADGELQSYETYTNIVMCPFCAKPYYQTTEEQVPGFRDRDYDICPYCKKTIRSSMSFEFRNYALSEDEIQSYTANKH